MLGTHQKIIGRILGWFLRWPRELNALQLQKTHANRKSTSKSRKHLHHFDSRWYKCSQHKQIKKHAENAHNKCCEHLQRVHCQIDESVFLICRCFFSICSLFLFLVVLWAFAACALSNWRKCFLNLQVFFLFAACFFFWLCCEHLQRVRCQIDESVFLICRGFFSICSPFLFWLCCEHLQRVRCQIDESVFFRNQIRILLCGGDTEDKHAFDLQIITWNKQLFIFYLCSIILKKDTIIMFSSCHYQRLGLTLKP